MIPYCPSRLSAGCALLCALVLHMAAVQGDEMIERFAKLYKPNQCGPIALCLASRVLGAPLAISEAIRLSGADDRGVSMAGLVKAARANGLRAEAYRSSLRHLSNLDTVAIVDYPRGHFSVLIGVQAETVRLWDLPEGEAVVPRREFTDGWGKNVIVLSVSP